MDVYLLLKMERKKNKEYRKRIEQLELAVRILSESALNNSDLFAIPEEFLNAERDIDVQEAISEAERIANDD